MKKILFIILLTLLVSISNAQDCQFQTVIPNQTFNQCNSNPWALTFSDEFNGSTLDLTKWSPVTGVNRDFNFDLQKAWHKPENLVVNNGILKIISKIESQTNMPVVTNWDPYTVKYANFNYTSGEIWSLDNFSFGKYEARIKVPTGTGLWPAFWLFGGPTSDEIDIFEFYGHKPDKVSLTSHYNGNQCPENYNFTNDFNFHIFTLIYEKDKIEWYIDGNLKRRVFRYYSILGQEVGCTINGFQQYIMNKSFPKEPMAIVFNTAIQSGNKAPNASVYFPVVMEIDWIRHYTRQPCQNIVINYPAQVIYNSNIYNILIGTNITINPNLPFQLQSNQQYHLIAKNDVVIKPGFSSVAGSNLIVSIDPSFCSSSLRTTESQELLNDDHYINEVENENINHIVNSNNKILIYPNPTNNSFNISLEFSDEKTTNVKIINSTGYEIYSNNLGSLRYSNKHFDLNLQTGIYMIKINHGEKEFVEKLIITQ